MVMKSLPCSGCACSESMSRGLINVVIICRYTTFTRKRRCGHKHCVVVIDVVCVLFFRSKMLPTYFAACMKRVPQHFEPDSR